MGKDAVSSVPDVDAVNVTPIAQEAPAASDVVQAGVPPATAGAAAKSAALVPVMAGRGTVSAMAEPVLLVRVKVSGALVTWKRLLKVSKQDAGGACVIEHGKAKASTGTSVNL